MCAFLVSFMRKIGQGNRDLLSEWVKYSKWIKDELLGITSFLEKFWGKVVETIS
ncbi:hypothetical protein D024_0865 [Vibrio parahaemolyticus 3259]|nr:hypothetical protein D024_0865 [Vibrio parahaemolyticus 3259]